MTRNEFESQRWVQLSRDGEEQPLEIKNDLLLGEDQSRILVVDDEVTIRELLATFLGKLGHKVVKASDGAAALEITAKEIFDIYFVDLMLPGLDGFRLMDQILATNPKARIVMITAYATLDNAMRAMRDGAFEFIPKPFDLRVITKTMKRLTKLDPIEKPTIGLRDELTRMYNRNYLIPTLQGQIDRVNRYKKPFGMLMVDVDALSRFNKKYGYETGDKILIDVAEVICQSLRGGDVSCRYEGGSFAVVLPDMTLEQSYQVAEKLRSSIAKKVGTPDESVSVSIGVTSATEQTENAKELIAAAISAMELAKTSGKNRTIAYDHSRRN